MSEVADERQTKLRYAGACRLCGHALDAGVLAVYERSTKTVRCVECPADEPPATVVPPDSGAPGASARREYERRHAKREVVLTARIVGHQWVVGAHSPS